MVMYIGLCRHDDKVYIVTEYVSCGSVRDLLKNFDTKIGWKFRCKMMLDVAKAMTYVHKKKIMHRDLKSKNLLVSTCRCPSITIRSMRVKRSRFVILDWRAIFLNPVPVGNI